MDRRAQELDRRTPFGRRGGINPDIDVVGIMDMIISGYTPPPVRQPAPGGSRGSSITQQCPPGVGSSSSICAPYCFDDCLVPPSPIMSAVANSIATGYRLGQDAIRVMPQGGITDGVAIPAGGAWSIEVRPSTGFALRTIQFSSTVAPALVVDTIESRGINQVRTNVGFGAEAFTGPFHDLPQLRALQYSSVSPLRVTGTNIGGADLPVIRMTVWGYPCEH